jgi:hypothetical protein
MGSQSGRARQVGLAMSRRTIGSAEKRLDLMEVYVDVD